MDLVYSVAVLGLAVFLFILLLLGDRMPDRPGWAPEGVAADVSTVAVAGLLAFGVAFGVRFFTAIDAMVIGLKEIVLLAAVLAVYYLILRALAPRRRLAQYASERARRSGASASSVENVVALTPANGDDHSPGASTLTKAA